MAKPFIHDKMCVRRWGGKPDDYAPINNWFDATKSYFPDNRHRVFRHHSEGIFECERTFGITITNSDGRLVSVRDIGELHVSSDFGGKFIPTVSDYLQEMNMQGWMNNGIGGHPPSYKKVHEYLSTRKPGQVTHIPFDTKPPATTLPVPEMIDLPDGDGISGPGVCRIDTSTLFVAPRDTTIPAVVLDGSMPERRQAETIEVKGGPEYFD